MWISRGVFWVALALCAAGCSGADEGAGTASGDEAPDAEATLEGSADAADSSAVVQTDADGEATVESDAGSELDQVVDAPTTDAVDAPEDPNVDSPPVSQVCGDGVRDVSLEECDDGVDGSSPPDLCTDECRVAELVVAPSIAADASPMLPPGHTYGGGAHPVAGGDLGFAVALVDESSPEDLQLAPFASAGEPRPIVAAVGQGTTVDASSSPVVAALPAGTFAVAWTDLATQSVALRLVDVTTSAAGALSYANAIAYDGQVGPDLIWTGTELVAAWTDGSGHDIKFREFAADLSPKGSESILAGTLDWEDSPSLAAWSGSWAAAWVASKPFAIPPQSWVTVRAGATTWSFGPTNAVVTGRPAVTAVDATHLLVVWSQAGELLAGILDVNDATVPAPVVVGSSAAEVLDEPSVASTGELVELVYRSTTGGVPSTRDVWLLEARWVATSSTLDASRPPIPLPRDPSHTVGEQGRPALCAVPFSPGGAIAATWIDRSGTLVTSGKEDVIATFLPAPVVRLGGADAGTDH